MGGENIARFQNKRIPVSPGRLQSSGSLSCMGSVVYEAHARILAPSFLYTRPRRQGYSSRCVCVCACMCMCMCAHVCAHVMFRVYVPLSLLPSPPPSHTEPEAGPITELSVFQSSSWRRLEMGRNCEEAEGNLNRTEGIERAVFKKLFFNIYF